MNPFEFDAANKLDDEQILDFYVEDFNYSRFIRSKRNVFLVGERGSGKTMTLLYNSLTISLLKAQRGIRDVDLSAIGIYVPCNTPLTHKSEYQLLDPFKAAVASEHFLVLQILYNAADALGKISDLLSADEETKVKRALEYALAIELPAHGDFFQSLKSYVEREVRLTQKYVNRPDSNSFYEDAYSFTSAVMPFINCLKYVRRLSKSHLLLMIDDAHDLNDYQVQCLNSWIAYRDHSDFSFKVATTKAGEPHRKTSTGGGILEGHDFIRIDMEQPFQNKESDFAQMANRIIKQRLMRVGISATPQTFFPINSQMLADLEECKKQAERDAREKYPNGSTKQIGDYVYKYYRVLYFRNRSSKANHPPYSGFELLVHLSTGVVRNLLEPCYWMYDNVISETGSESGESIDCIPPHIQSKIIESRSTRMWEELESGLHRLTPSCSEEQGKQLLNLFSHLADLFWTRLREHRSEPRAIAFSISALDSNSEAILTPLLTIARTTQYLYTRIGTAKEKGRKQTYYVPNRMLWPTRNLDPVGQHSRVSLRASDIVAAAISNRPFPFVSESTNEEWGLFDER